MYAGTWWSIAGLSLMTVGLYAGNAHLFPLPSVFLAGPALASGIAWVNSVGILGGSASPPIIGQFKDYTGSYAGGLYALAGFGRDGRHHLGALRARDAGGAGSRPDSRGDHRVS